MGAGVLTRWRYAPLVVTDWATIASMSTAGGTLVLAGATFASVRSANKAARVAERSLAIGLRPVLVPSRPEDPTEKIMFGDDAKLVVRGGTAGVEELDGNVYLGIPLRNVGAGLAVLQGWYVWPERAAAAIPHADPNEFRMLQRDLYIASGDTGYWQGALRGEDDELKSKLRASIAEPRRISVDILYGDHEGGQHMVSRFGLTRRESSAWYCAIIRHWSVEGFGPRETR